MIPKFTVGVNRYYYCCIILFKAILNFFFYFRAFGRRPCREPVPFQEILPLRLKDSVSGKGDKTSGNLS